MADALPSEGLNESIVLAGQPGSVVTRMVFAVEPELAWANLMFYEEVDEGPPLLLRLLLPTPLGTKGEKARVGDEATCVYERGHLVKRTTKVEAPTLYEFEVIEQKLALGGSLQLHGGRYVLRRLGPGQTEIALQTRYTSAKRPRWLWRPLERFVCHLFHRFLLGAMRRSAERA